MKKNSKKDIINLFFSAFLVTAYVICSFFFSQLASSLDPGMGGIINVLIYSVFGLILFYATRVGEGKQILRFSPMTLVFLVIPAFYIILAFLVPALPFGEQISENSLIMTVAAVAFGYGIPYTFLSGYEIEAETDAEEDKKDQALESDSEEQKEEPETDGEAETSEEDSDAEDQEGFELEEQDYFADEESEILSQQDMLDAENNSEEAAFCYNEAEAEDGETQSEESEPEEDAQKKQ